MENRNLETTRQELATRLVQREVMCCASTLISGVAQLVGHVPYRAMRDAFCTDEDEIMDLCRRPDYEEAARQFIMDDADVDQLEEIADEHGYWGDVLDDCLPELEEADIDPDDEDNDGRWTFLGAGENFTDVEDAREAAIEHSLDKIRASVWELVNTQDEYQWVCNEYSLDPDNIEVYEHWIVTDWLKRKLGERGEVVGDFAGLDIWGRCCTGQSISMDSVIQDIACELWADELPGA